MKARVAEAKRRKYAKEKADPEAWAAKLAATQAWRLANPERLAESDRAWRSANPEMARAKVQRRRARLADAFVEDVDMDVLYLRDGGVCGICEEVIDRDIRWPDAMSQTLDHIVPLARGGTHEYANAQLAHAVCNFRKGDRVAQGGRLHSS